MCLLYLSIPLYAFFYRSLSFFYRFFFLFVSFFLFFFAFFFLFLSFFLLHFFSLCLFYFSTVNFFYSFIHVFIGRPGVLGSIPGRVIQKALKMVFDTSLLNTQQYKIRIKGKVEQSREMSSAPLHLSVVAIEKGAFGSPSTRVANFTRITILATFYSSMNDYAFYVTNFPYSSNPLQHFHISISMF